MTWDEIIVRILLIGSLVGCMRLWYLEGKLDAYRNMAKNKHSKEQK